MRDYDHNRVLEIIPATILWLTLVLALVFSFIQPIWAIYFIIVFDLYWLFRIIYLLIFLMISWGRYRRALRHNWWERVKNDHAARWPDYYHLLILPVYKEPLEVVDATFQSLIASRYDLKQMIVTLTGEERQEEHFRELSATITERYQHHFKSLLINVHPKDIPGELPGKSANANSGARAAVAYIDHQGIAHDHVIVSNFDIDTKPHQDYFACVAWHYLQSDDPTHQSYQPLTIYTNNLWESNPLVRVVAASTTFWLLTDLARTDRLFTFSSHSMSLRALVDVGYWDETIVTEDSRIFLQCFLHYDGNYRVQPIYTPVYMNTVEIGHLWRSLKNQYLQMRRWAWGVEHFPYMCQNFFGRRAHRNIAWRRRFTLLFSQLEGMYTWATAPLLILLLGQLPLLLASRSDAGNLFVQNAPFTLQRLMQLSLIGLIATTVLYTIMLPSKPERLHWYHYLVIFGQWILVPITLVLFGALPAVDAQTRLALGGRWRLGFWNTEKK